MAWQTQLKGHSSPSLTVTQRLTDGHARPWAARTAGATGTAGPGPPAAADWQGPGSDLAFNLKALSTAAQAALAETVPASPQRPWAARGGPAVHCQAVTCQCQGLAKLTRKSLAQAGRVRRGPLRATGNRLWPAGAGCRI